MNSDGGPEARSGIDADGAAHGRQELLTRIVETVTDGIYVVDRNGRMSFANAAAERILGLTRDRIAEHSFDDPIWEFTTLDGAPFPEDEQPFVRVMRTGQAVYGVEQCCRRPDGSRIIVSINAAPLTDADGAIVGEVATLTDISERKAADRLKNEFISTVSHELRTPLTSILGSLGLVNGGVAGDVPVQARAMLEIAHKNAERLVRLINDILDIEKIESGRMIFRVEPMPLMPLIEQAIEANRTYGEQLGVRFALEGPLPGVEVRADADRLTQVITNLLSNAAKFSPRGQAVSVSVSRRGDAIRVAVRDRGPGIPPAFRDRIFQKFAQADSSDRRQKGGTGLGLSISKAIVERLGGQIGFDTAAGKGTTFYFDLPEWQLEPTATAALDDGRLPRLLVCEDDADISTLLRLMLERDGFAVDVARSAAEAKWLLARRRYDGMTIDLILPDQDGISLIRDLRGDGLCHTLPIVVVSVKAQQGKAELNGEAFLVADWIDKPIDHARLVRAVREAVAQNGGRRPLILHVEDDPDVVRVVTAILQDTASVESAGTLAEARRRIRDAACDLVVLDLALPDGSGLDLLPLLRSRTPPVPVVVFSAHEIKPDAAKLVAAALVKSRASNQEVIETIKACVTQRR